METTYTGSCHCKSVRFEVTGAFEDASDCNCSICSRVGWTMKSVPRDRFKLLAGEDAQTDYTFGSRSIHHLFCKTCGVHAYAPFKYGDEEKVIVNLRCLEDFDLGKVPVKTFDGKSY